MKQYLLLLFFIMCIDIVHAQELNVKSFVVKTNDITARTQPRQDINGNDCALIKVQLAASGAEFGGNVVGNVSYNKSEYLVYMSEGSKRLSVKLEGYLPLEASFEDYGIKALEGKTTYVMTISGATVARLIEAPKIKTGWKRSVWNGERLSEVITSGMTRSHLKKNYPGAYVALRNLGLLPILFPGKGKNGKKGTSPAFDETKRDLLLDVV